MIGELSVIVPVFNEEAGLGESLNELLEAMGALVPAVLEGFEIVVVDDGSTDGTRSVLKTMEDRVRIVRNERNCGYGAAIKRGVRASHHAWVLIIDGDASYPAGDIQRLILATSDGVAMTVGSRSLQSIPNPRSWNLAKSAAQRALTAIMQTKIPDLNSGMRLFERNLALELEDVLSDRFSYSSGLTIASLRAGRRIVFEPIGYRERRGRSKVRPVSFTLTFMQSVVRAYVRTRSHLRRSKQR